MVKRQQAVKRKRAGLLWNRGPEKQHRGRTSYTRPPDRRKDLGLVFPNSQPGNKRQPRRVIPPLERVHHQQQEITKCLWEMALRLPCPIRGHWCIWAAPVRGTLEASKAPLCPRASGSPLSPGQPGSTNCNLASEAASPGSLNPPPSCATRDQSGGGHQQEGSGLRGAQTLLTRGPRTASRHTQNRYNHNHRPANKASWSQGLTLPSLTNRRWVWGNPFFLSAA